MAATAQPQTKKSVRIEYDLSADGLIESVNDAVGIHNVLGSMVGFRFAQNESARFSLLVNHARNQLGIVAKGDRAAPADLRKTIALAQEVREMLDNHFEEFAENSPTYFGAIISELRKRSVNIAEREAGTLIRLQKTLRETIETETDDAADDQKNIATAFNALANYLLSLEVEAKAEREAERQALRKTKAGATLQLLNSLPV